MLLNDTDKAAVADLLPFLVFVQYIFITQHWTVYLRFSFNTQNQNLSRRMTSIRQKPCEGRPEDVSTPPNPQAITFPL